MVFYLNCISHHHRKIAFSGCTHENHHTLSQRFYTYTIPYNHARDSDRNAQKRNNNKKSNNLFKLKCNALYQKHWCRLNGCVCVCARFSPFDAYYFPMCAQKNWNVICIRSSEFMIISCGLRKFMIENRCKYVPMR